MVYNDSNKNFYLMSGIITYNYSFSCHDSSLIKKQLNYIQFVDLWKYTQGKYNFVMHGYFIFDTDIE